MFFLIFVLSLCDLNLTNFHIFLFTGEVQINHLSLFNNRRTTNSKKKRKSRTAFTNNQIFELEKRFLYQKYLSPADRDEIALSLGLSNAQVITWFQNRRAKLKRDMEELKKDVETTQLLSAAGAGPILGPAPTGAENNFLQNIQNLSILKKKAVPAGGERGGPADPCVDRAES